jgi:pSer/pThr/pTyr-binding forkhead associated (FHA) protein
MTVDKPKRPYIMLESIPDKKSANRNNMNRNNPLDFVNEEVKHAKSLYVIAAEESKAVKLGRGHQSDIVLEDISVSRTHSELVFKNDSFYLRDLDSKFGTLVEFKECREITDNLKVQCGRTVYTFRFSPKVRTCHYLP